MVIRFEFAPNATPLDPDETAGLLARHITTQAELNEWEQANILDGQRWAVKQCRRDMLDDAFVRELHHRMFSKTWKWAGQFRHTDKNIGVDWQQVPVQLCNLLGDAKTQIEFKSRPPRNDNGMRLKLGRNFVHKAIAQKNSPYKSTYMPKSKCLRGGKLSNNRNSASKSIG